MAELLLVVFKFKNFDTSKTFMDYGYQFATKHPFAKVTVSHYMLYAKSNKDRQVA
jgi:hypothetical protein